jgi:hypothetical protein
LSDAPGFAFFHNQSDTRPLTTMAGITHVGVFALLRRCLFLRFVISVGLLLSHLSVAAKRPIG